MPLPTSGIISFNDIQNEFGGTNPISLSEYYGVSANVPVSGTIKVADFYGQSANRFWYSTNYPIVYDTLPGTQTGTMTHFRYANNDMFSVTSNTNVDFTRYFSFDKNGNTTRWWYKTDQSFSAPPGTLTSQAGGLGGMAPSGNVVLLLRTYATSRWVLVRLNSDGSVAAAANSTNTISVATITNSNVFICGTGQNTLQFIANIGNSDLTTIAWRRYTPNSTFSLRSLTYNKDQSAIYVSGAMGSRPLWMSFDTDGTTRWLRIINDAANYGAVCIDTGPDNGNNLVCRFTGTSNVNSFIKITDTPSVVYMRRFPAGREIKRVAIDPNGNVYTASVMNNNGVVFKQVELVRFDGNTSPTIQWTNRFSITGYTDDTDNQYQIDCRYLDVSTANEIYIHLEVIHYIYDDGDYVENNIVVSQLYRLPTDGSGTGTHGNIVYTSNSNPTMASPTNPSLTTISITFNTSNAINMVSNTVTITSQSNTLSTTAIT